MKTGSPSDNELETMGEAYRELLDARDIKAQPVPQIAAGLMPVARGAREIAAHRALELGHLSVTPPKGSPGDFWGRQQNVDFCMPRSLITSRTLEPCAHGMREQPLYSLLDRTRLAFFRSPDQNR